MSSKYSSTGRLTYHDNGWVVLYVKGDLGAYYRWWIVREFYKSKLNPPMHGEHITAIAGKYEDVRTHPKWRLYDNHPIEFQYNNQILTDGTYYWITVYSKFLENLRLELGLPNPIPRWPFHITIGNTKTS